jgi:hypothetical protein
MAVFRRYAAVAFCIQAIALAGPSNGLPAMPFNYWAGMRRPNGALVRIDLHTFGALMLWGR